MKFSKLFQASALIALLINAYAEDLPEPASIKPPVFLLPITELRNAAAGFALTKAQFANTILEACSKIGSPFDERAKSVWLGWRERNWAYVEASRGWVYYVKAQVARTRGSEAASAFQNGVFSDIAKQASATLWDVLPTGKPEPSACERQFELLSLPSLDVSKASKEFGPYLDEISAFHRDVMERTR